ncbi:apolipoprotein N-acyltransferase [Methylomagnum sp.]
MLLDALALLGGLLLPLAFAPYDFPFLAIVALVLLFATWLDATPGRAFRRGYLFGLGQIGFGMSWIYISVHDYGGASAPAAGGVTALFAAVIAIYTGLAGWLARRFSPGSQTTQALGVFPAVWVLMEWFRGWFLTGFPCLELGYSQTDTPLAGLAPVLGSYGVGWAVAVLAGLLLLAPRWTGGWRYAAMAGVMLLVGLGRWAGQVQWTHPAGQPFRATLLQGNISQETKWKPETRLSTLRLYASLTRQHWDSKLIVWPETAVPAFYHQATENYLDPLAAEAKTHGTDLLVGIPYHHPTASDYYNALASLGRTPGFYFKRHLVPFGEYLPLRPLLGWVLDVMKIPLSSFTPGDARQPPLIAAGHPLAASICYEDLFGQEVLAALPDAAYLVNVTNDAWFGDSAAPHLHTQVSRMRALETGRWMLHTTNTGVTAIIDPKGAVTARAPPFQTADLTAMVTPMGGRTPFIVWGNGPVVMGAGLLLGGLAGGRRVMNGGVFRRR